MVRISRTLVIRTLAIGTLACSGVGVAEAGSCTNNVSYDGPSSKLFIYIKNESSSSLLAIMGRAKNTTDIREENDSYKELDRDTVVPGEEYLLKDDTSANANKVYSVSMLNTLNMFRIHNDAGLTSGTTKFEGKDKNMEYKDYNETESKPLTISCDRDYTGAGKWKVTFKVTDR